MCDLFSSKQKTTSTQSTKIPANFQNLMNRTISFANEGLDTPFQAYNAPRIAELSGNEQAGIAAAGSNAGMYQDLINMSMVNNADMQAKGGLPSAGDIQGLINPYVDYVLGNSLNRLNEASDRNMTNIGSMAGMAGAFGGSRHGVLEGANLAELLKSSQELSANTYSDAYDKGMSNWFQGQNLRRGTIQDGMNIATQGQQYNTQDINNLMGTGLTERTRNQGLLDFAYSEFMREQQDPFTKAGFAGSVMGSYPTNLFTRTGVEETTQTPSAFSQIAGVGLAAAGLMTGNPAALAGLGSGAASLGGGGAFKGIGTMGSVGNSGGQLGYVQPTGIAGTNYSGIQGYAGGGQVSDPIGALIRTLEQEESDKKAGKKTRLRDRAAYKFGRQSDMVEDRRGWHESRVPSEAMLNALHAEGAAGNPWDERDDVEAEHYRALKSGNGGIKSQMSLEELINVINTKGDYEDAMKLLHPSKFSKGGKVRKVKPGKDGVYRAGSGGWFDDVMNVISPAYMLGDMNPKNQEFQEPNSILYGASGGRGQGGDRHRGYSEPQATTQRQPFDWQAFIQRMGIQNFVSPNAQNTFPSQSAPRLPSRTPNLSGYMQQMNQRIAGQGLQGSPRGFAEGGEVRYPDRSEMTDDALIMQLMKASEGWRPAYDPFEKKNFWDNEITAVESIPGLKKELKAAEKAKDQYIIDRVKVQLARAERYRDYPSKYAEGGTIISGDKKTRRKLGSNLLEGMKHDGSLEDITYLLDQYPDEEWAPTEGSFDGTHQPVEVDKKEALRIALQKHETGAKEYENPNYLANTFKGKENSHAFGLGQWQPSSWNAMATSYNKKNKDKVRFMTQEDVKADRLPSKEEQNKIWGLWEKQILRDGKGDYAKAFAAHQLGGGDLAKVLNAPVGAKMKDVVGEQIAKNVSAKNETVGDYFNRLNKYIGEGENYLKNKLSQNGGNLTDVVQAMPNDAMAFLAEQRPHKLGNFTEDQIRAAMKASGDTVFRGVQPDGRQDRIRKGPDLGEPLSALETVMGGRLPKNAEPNYLDSLLSVPVTREALNDPRFVKGGRRPIGYSKGGTIKMPDGSYRNKDGSELEETLAQQRYREAVNASRKGVGMDPLDEGKWGADYRDAAREAGSAADQAHQEIVDKLAEPYTKKSRVGQGLEMSGRVLGSLVPMSAELVGRGVQGGANVMDYLFGDINPKTQASAPKTSAKSNMNQVNMGIPSGGNEYATPIDFGTEPDNLIEGVGTGDVDGVLADPLARMATGRNQELQGELDSLMLDRIRALKNEQETETDPLKSIFGDYNQGLFKMGMGILANSGYPNSAGEAIAKGVLGAQESEENKMLAKNERRNARLKELLNARYMNAMIEQMSPEQKMAVEKLKGEYDLRVEGMKDQRAEMQKQADFKRQTQLEIIKSLMTKAGLGGLKQQEADYLRSLTGYQAEIDTSDIEDSE